MLIENESLTGYDLIMRITVQKASVRFPIYDASHRSIKKSLVSVATGGLISSNGKGPLHVDSLQKIDLDVSEGEKVAIVGHNGCGKSTLLRLIAGVYEPTEGRCSVVGDITSLIDPTLGMDLDATGYENIFLRGLFLNLSAHEMEAKIGDIADFSELGNFLEMPVRTYSSGMLLRLAFAVSTCVQPEIVLLDEWLSVGDAEFRVKAEKRLNDFVARAGILVIATHDLALIQSLDARVIKLSHGKIVMEN